MQIILIYSKVDIINSSFFHWKFTGIKMAELEGGSVEIERKVIPVNGIPTVISTLLPSDTSPKVSVVLIPGNPGLVEYYDVFISALFEASGKTLAIYGISHAGTYELNRNISLKTYALIEIFYFYM
jgi:hypothetical protein